MRFERLLEHDGFELGEVAGLLCGPIQAIACAHAADVLIEAILLLEGEHGAGEEGLFVIIPDEGEKVEAALHALRGDLHIIIHEDDVGGLGFLLACLDHATRKAPRTPHVWVRMHNHAVTRQSLRIEGPAVVDDMHGEVSADGLMAVAKLAPQELYVGDDELLLLEGRRGHGKLHGANHGVIHLREVVGLLYPHGR